MAGGTKYSGVLLSTDQRPWHKLHRELELTAPVYDHATPAARVRRHAVSAPNAPALHYRDTTISYAGLDTWSERFASVLRQGGFGPDDRLGILLPNMPEFVVAIVGCSRLGGVISGVSTLLSSSELLHQLRDAQISALVTSSDYLTGKIAPLLQDLPDLQIIITVGGKAALEKCDKYVVAFPGPESDRSGMVALANRQPDDLLFIQYTGGTTGVPKGAMLTVQNAMYDVQLYASPHGLEPYRECVATAFPLYHMAGMSVLLLALFFGGSFMLIPNPRDIDAFCDMMRRYPPTVLGAVPTLFQMLMENPGFATIDFSRLKTAISGGAPFPVATKLQLELIIGKDRLSDNFGMTETGPVYVNNPKTRLKHASVGIPLPGVDVRIVDVETGTQELAIGEQGEIITSGPHVMKGYFNNPEGTAAALRELDGRTWMYTGDAGYIDEEGYIYLCDRLKDMAVVGGYKVFSVEVEGKLKLLDAVRHAALVAVPDPARAGSDILHLFVEPIANARNENKDDIVSTIVDFCKREMAPYKVPRHVHIIDEMPLTPIGKLNKKLLRAQLLGH